MSKYTFVVFTNATEGKDEEFNEWYNNTHIPDVVRAPGFVAATRYRLAVTDPPQPSAHKYMALYEVETDDLDKTMQGLLELAGTDAMVISPALDMNSASATYFEPITERMAAPD